MSESDLRRDSMRKLTVAVAAALSLGTVMMAAGSIAFARGGGHFAGGGGHSGGGHFTGGGGHFAGGRLGRGFRGRLGGVNGFGGWSYYGDGSCYVLAPDGYTWLCY
jgi:hypothetical protein